MKSDFLKNNINKRKKAGSALAIVICLFAVIIALVIGFFSSSGQRRYATKKLNNISFTREYAFSIAELAKTYLKETFLSEQYKKLNLKDNNNQTIKDLREDFLSQEINNVNWDRRIVVLFKEELLKYFQQAGNLISDIGFSKKKIEIKNNKIDFYFIQPDFTIIDKSQDQKVFEKSYPREKTGLIHIHFFLKCDNQTEEEYDFGVRVKVTSAMIPVLSKFNLYVAEALKESDNSDKFNQLITNKAGKKAKGSKWNPWNLKNQITDGFPVLSGPYDALIKSNIGLVYLGSKNPIVLGLSRSLATDTEFIARENLGCGEPMQFLAQTSRSYIISSYLSDENVSYKLRYHDLGFAKDEGNETNDKSSMTNSFIKELVKEEDKEKLEKSSILKLYGAGQWKDCSPTLVLGNVNSKRIRVAQLGIGEIGLEEEQPYLPYIKQSDFKEFSSGVYYPSFDESGDEDTEIAKEILDQILKEKGTITYKFYEENVATHIQENPYNVGLFNYISNLNYYHNNREIIYPEYECFLDDELFRYAYGKEADGSNPLNKNDWHNIPKYYNSIYNDENDKDKKNNITLENIDVFKNSLALNAFEFDKTRSSYICKIKEKENFIDKLIKYGLAKKSNNKVILDFEGWLYVEAEKGLELGNIEYSHNCGIALAKGDIIIDGNISKKDDAKNCILYLISLDKAIKITTNTKKLDTALCAFGGQIELEGEASNNILTVNGNMAMRNLNNLDKMKRGVNLDYNEILSALPKTEELKESNCRELLMYTIYDNVELLY